MGGRVHRVSEKEKPSGCRGYGVRSHVFASPAGLPLDAQGSDRNGTNGGGFHESKVRCDPVLSSIRAIRVHRPFDPGGAALCVAARRADRAFGMRRQRRRFGWLGRVRAKAASRPPHSILRSRPESPWVGATDESAPEDVATNAAAQRRAGPAHGTMTMQAAPAAEAGVQNRFANLHTLHDRTPYTADTVGRHITRRRPTTTPWISTRSG